MLVLPGISFLAGALLGQQHYKVLVLLPAMLVTAALAIAIGVADASGGWLVLLTAAGASATLQVGYLIGIVLGQLLKAASSRPASFPRTAPTLRHPAR
jgi:hypothetical protein